MNTELHNEYEGFYFLVLFGQGKPLGNFISNNTCFFLSVAGMNSRKLTKLFLKNFIYLF